MKRVEKGIEIQYMADGKIRYMPFAIYRELRADPINDWTPKEKDVKYTLRNGVGDFEFLWEGISGETYENEADAIRTLECCIKNYEEEKISKTILRKEIKTYE